MNNNNQIIELTQLELDTLNTYWANVKIKQPKLFKILSEIPSEYDVTIKIIKALKY